MPILRTVNLEQRAGSAKLLKNINLEVERGEVFIIVGPTGAGKTTLLRLLDLLDAPYAGDIYFDGRKATGPDVNVMEVRRRMAMVFQKPVVFNTSVYDNIAYPLKVRGAANSIIRSRVGELLEICGLSGLGKRRAKTLSGGEAQRVALARAVITGPALLFLDEPTANLDPASVKTIEDLLAGFNRRDSLTVVMTTHDLQQVQRLAQRVGVLMQGELVQAGTPREIFHLPGDIRIAGFVGIKNILRGIITRQEGGMAVVEVKGRVIEAISKLPAGAAVDIYVRPEEIVLSLQELQGSARNALAGTIISVGLEGPLGAVVLDCGFRLEALVTARSAMEMALRPGQAVYATIKATAVKVLPALENAA
ncbi:MAG: ABC transporter ATP-binding protein [Chloroflexi bacterium]|nr:ABC transporter ATP-binding protein [Chloroflexota bacterium]